jgi:hypothetical protein
VVPEPVGVDGAPDGTLGILGAAGHDAGPLLPVEAGLSLSLKELKGTPEYREPSPRDAGKAPALKETVSVSGRMPKELVQRALKDLAKSCVASAPTTVKVRFVIDAAGRVASVDDAGSASDAAFRCLQGKLKRLEFPPPEGGVAVVTHTLAFE